MKIKNIEGMSAADLQNESEKGGRFVYYAFTISLLVVTFKKTSGVYLIRAKESAVSKGVPYTLLSFILGWWGFPFGPKYTIESIRTNINGGKDVSDEVMQTVAGHLLFQEAEVSKQQRLNSL
jgi:hypothetical protein